MNKEEPTPLSKRIAKLTLDNDDIFDTSFNGANGVGDMSMNEDWTIDTQDMINDLSKPAEPVFAAVQKTPIAAPPQPEFQEAPQPTTAEMRERQDALKQELRGIRSVNEMLEKVTGNLKVGVNKMNDFQKTVKQTEQLLGLWVRILSQSEHTQKILLEGRWQGASKDLEDVLAEQQQEKDKYERERQAAIERQQKIEQANAAAAAAASSAANSKKTVVKKTVGGRPQPNVKGAKSVYAYTRPKKSS